MSALVVQVVVITSVSVLLLFLFATRADVDIEAILERKVDERVGRLQQQVENSLERRAEEQRLELADSLERQAKELERQTKELERQTKELLELELQRQLQAAVEELKSKVPPEPATASVQQNVTAEGVPLLSSLPAITPVPNEQLDAVLAARSEAFQSVEGHKGRDVVLLVFNRAYVDLLSNLLCTLRHVNITNVVGVALDEEALALCPSLGLDCALPGAPFLRAASGDFHYHGNSDFKSLSKLKSRNVLEVLLRGYNVFLVDGDVVFFRDPRQLLRSGSREFDLQIQSDSPYGAPKAAYLNTGVYYIKASKRSINFLQVMWEYGHTRAVDMSEQATFADLEYKVQSGLVPGVGLQRATLEIHEFCNGANYFSQPPEGANGVYAVRPDASDHCYLLHFNWIFGSNKLKTMRGNHFWYLDEQNQCLLTAPPS